MAVKRKRSIKFLFIVFITTFIIASILSSGTEVILRVLPLTLTWVLLIIVITIGVVFDIIGIAVAAADEAPHHCRAAKKVFGSKQSIFLIRRADKVANFANDIVGDITGTLSGAMGAAIIILLTTEYSYLSEWQVILNILLLALIASLTVTGKAWGKTYAINEANNIIDITGRVIATIEKFTGFDLTKTNKRGGK